MTTDPQPVAASGASPETERLLARIRAGEKGCFLELIQPYARSIYLVANSILKNREDAEEVAQETVFRAFQRLDQLRDIGSLKSWLLQIAVNEARQRLRHRQRHPCVSLDEEFGDEAQVMPRQLADWREIPSVTLERKETREHLRRALERLPPHYRQVFLLRDVQHLAEKEAAQVLGVSASTVKMRLHRARLQLREDLAPVFRKRWKDRLSALWSKS